MKIGDLVRDKVHREDIAMVIDETPELIKLWWLSGNVAGDVSHEYHSKKASILFDVIAPAPIATKVLAEKET